MTPSKTLLLTAAILAGFAATAQAHPRGQGDRERPSFAELDTNGDGVLSAEELKAPMAARFAEADTNGDGALSAEELAAQAEKRRAERMAKKMVERMDENGDGLIQPEEMGGDRAGKMFERIDADEDGSISQEEFDAAAEKMKERGERRERGHGHDRGHGHGKGDRGGRSGG